MSLASDRAEIAAVILAAGAAHRMGGTKQLLTHRGKPLVQHAIDAAAASDVERVVVVTGAHADQVEAAIAGAAVARNPDYERGNVSSLACGVDAAQAEAIVVLAADQPDVSVTAIDAMVELWRRRRPWAAVAEYEDRPGHPFLLSMEAAEAVIATDGEKALGRLLIEADDPRVVRLGVAGPAPIDVNTPEDYRRLTGE